MRKLTVKFLNDFPSTGGTTSGEKPSRVPPPPDTDAVFRIILVGFIGTPTKLYIFWVHHFETLYNRFVLHLVDRQQPGPVVF